MTRHAVYRFWDAEDRCLYVGCTSDFVARYRHHQTYREWFPEVARLDVQMHPDCATARVAEAAWIRRLNPIHNRALTDHDTPRSLPCRRCKSGYHRECLGMRDGLPCSCTVCAGARASAAASP